MVTTKLSIIYKMVIEFFKIIPIYKKTSKNVDFF